MNSLLLALALVCVPQEESPDPIVTLEFEWPAEGSVRVREEMEKKGNRAVTSYVLRWSPAEDGQVTLLEYSDFEFLELNGIDATLPLMKDAVRQAEVLASAIPSLRIDADGTLLGFEGYGEMIDRILARWNQDKDLDPEARDQVAQSMRQPAMQAAMEAKTAETWLAWVGMWAGLEVERGADEVWELDVEVTGGATRELVVAYGDRTHHRGLECVEIEMEGVADEALLLTKLFEMMGLFAEGSDVKLPEDLPLSRASRTDTTRGIYALDGLRPLEVRRNSSVSVWSTEDDEPQVQFEQHHYFFEWEDLEPAPAGVSAF